MDIYAKLYGSQEETTAPSRNQLQAELQYLLKSICLNTTRHAVPQARKALGHCLTTGQLLAYPFDHSDTKKLDQEEIKAKLSETAQQPEILVF